MCVHSPPPGQSICMCQHQRMEMEMMLQAQAEIIAWLLKQRHGNDPPKINLIST